jgi:succinate dehydrogenase/fumarate reductase flavoprotein subunit
MDACLVAGNRLALVCADRLQYHPAAFPDFFSLSILIAEGSRVFTGCLENKEG